MTVIGDDGEHWLHNPPKHFLTPARQGYPNASFAFGASQWQESCYWEGYFDAGRILLEQMCNHPCRKSLILPALFNLRHAVELALKWHIRHAGAEVPSRAGHNLTKLIAAFRDAANESDNESYHLSERILGWITELASLDPRSIAFRYATDIKGTLMDLPRDRWDLHSLRIVAKHMSSWFDDLGRYLDWTTPDYRDILHDFPDLEIKFAHSHSIVPGGFDV